jgi:hypothetical protein
MVFDRSIWRAHVGKRLDAFARNPQQDLALSGSPSLLAHLAACTLHPFLTEFEQRPISAVQVLGSITSGDGANQIVRQAVALRYQTGRLLDMELRHSAAMRTDIERLMIAVDTIHQVRQRLHGWREDWFRNTLDRELHTHPANEFVQIRRRLSERWKSFYDIFRDLKQRRGNYTQEDLILLYVGLNDSASNVRAEAARRLGEYAATPHEKLVAKLIQVALYDRDLETRNAAARALGALRERIVSPHLIESIGKHLSDKDRFVRSAASLLLAELGEIAGKEPLIGKLTNLLDDSDPYTREAAACALGRMGPAAVNPKVMSALTEALQDYNEHVHDAALDSLTRLRNLRTMLYQKTTISEQHTDDAAVDPGSMGHQYADHAAHEEYLPTPDQDTTAAPAAAADQQQPQETDTNSRPQSMVQMGNSS